MPKSLLRLGAGGTVRILTGCLAGCHCIVPDGLLNSSTKSIPPPLVQKLVGSRIAMCYDLELGKDKLNLGLFKNIVAADFFDVSGVSCSTSVSLFAASNGEVDVVAQPEYYTAPRSRCTVTPSCSSA
jgi:hypothetical protein